MGGVQLWIHNRRYIPRDYIFIFHHYIFSTRLNAENFFIFPLMLLRLGCRWWRWWCLTRLWSQQHNWPTTDIDKADKDKVFLGHSIHFLVVPSFFFSATSPLRHSAISSLSWKLNSISKLVLGGRHAMAVRCMYAQPQT